MPAEWEPTGAVLMAWPHSGSDWAYMLDEARRCFAGIIAAVAPRAKVILVGPEEPEPEYLPDGPEADNVLFIDIPTNDTWTRDYGPICVEVDDNGRKQFAVCDFKFNGWGLKFAADRDNLVTSALYHTGIFNGIYANFLSFVLEGGSIESDGRGTILTTSHCLASPNRNGGMDLKSVVRNLASGLGARRVLFLNNGNLEGDDTDGHIDTLARLIPPGDTILYVGCGDPSDSHYECLKKMLDDLRALRIGEGDDERPYNLIELPLPDPVYDPDDGHRLPATYANFLILNDAVLLPVYGQPMKDSLAIKIVAAAMPGYTVVPVDCSALIRQHGSLHCSTMQIPAGAMAI